MTATVSTAAQLVSAASDVATEARSVLSALASILDRLAGSAESDLGDTSRQIAQLPCPDSLPQGSPYSLFARCLSEMAEAQQDMRDGAQQDASTVREILDVLASLPLGASLVPVQTRQEQEEPVQATSSTAAFVSVAFDELASPEKPGEPSLTDLDACMDAAVEGIVGTLASMTEAPAAPEESVIARALRASAEMEKDPQVAEWLAGASSSEEVTTAANPPAAEEPGAPLAQMRTELQMLSEGGPDEDEETEDGGTDEDDLVTQEDVKTLGWSDLRILAARLGIAMPRGTTRADVERQVLQHYGLGGPASVEGGNS